MNVSIRLYKLESGNARTITVPSLARWVDVAPLLGADIQLWYGNMEVGGATEMQRLPTYVYYTGTLNFWGHKDINFDAETRIAQPETRVRAQRVNTKRDFFIPGAK